MTLISYSHILSFLPFYSFIQIFICAFFNEKELQKKVETARFSVQRSKYTISQVFNDLKFKTRKKGIKNFKFNGDIYPMPSSRPKDLKNLLLTLFKLRFLRQSDKCTPNFFLPSNIPFHIQTKKGKRIKTFQF